MAEGAGADALSLVNTFVGMAIDIETRTPRISNVTAGLSGPGIKPVALRMVYQAARAVKIPIIGIGGIASAEDALEFIIAGARAVQVGTANFYDPGTSIRIVEGIRDYCRRKRSAPRGPRRVVENSEQRFGKLIYPSTLDRILVSISYDCISFFRIDI